MQSELDQLQTRAKQVLTDLVENPPNRPKFIEFSGTPKSGKSTCIDIVSHFFRRIRLDGQDTSDGQSAGSNPSKFSILAPTEGASRRTPQFLKDDWVAFNTWSASYALSHILEGRHHSDRYHLVILDRGLSDALAWFQILEERNKINESDKEKVQQFLMIDSWRSEIDAVFLFTADDVTSMERENAEKSIDAPGSAMNNDFLRQLNGVYHRIQEEFGHQFKTIVNIDTSGRTNPQARTTAIQVVDRILNLFETTNQ